MAIENVVKLMQVAQEKPEVAAKLEAVTGSEQVVEIGASEGLQFTTEEVEALIAATQEAPDGELNEEALEAVAGGMGVNNIPVVGEINKNTTQMTEGVQQLLNGKTQQGLLNIGSGLSKNAGTGIGGQAGAGLKAIGVVMDAYNKRPLR